MPARAREILEAGSQEEAQLLMDAFGVARESENAGVPDGPGPSASMK